MSFSTSAVFWDTLILIILCQRDMEDRMFKSISSFYTLNNNQKDTSRKTIVMKKFKNQYIYIACRYVKFITLLVWLYLEEKVENEIHKELKGDFNCISKVKIKK